MGERLVADSVMTPDGDVVLPGPVDKDGHRVPFDTTDLYGPRGEHYKVRFFARLPHMDSWLISYAFNNDLIAVSSLYLKAPDSYERVLEDLYEAVQQGVRSGRPYCVYNVARGLCRGHEDKDGKCKLVGFADACTLTMTGDIWSRVERLCKGDGEKDGSEK